MMPRSICCAILPILSHSVGRIFRDFGEKLNLCEKCNGFYCIRRKILNQKLEKHFQLKITPLQSFVSDWRVNEYGLSSVIEYVCVFLPFQQCWALAWINRTLNITVQVALLQIRLRSVLNFLNVKIKNVNLKVPIFIHTNKICCRCQINVCWLWQFGISVAENVSYFDIFEITSLKKKIC